jgi:uncharacterized protein DUF4838
MVSRMNVPQVFVRLVIVGCLALHTAATAADTSGDVELVRGGQARFALVLDKDRNERTTAAVADLVRCIRAMTGAAVPRDKADDRILFYVGEAGEFAQLDIEVPSLEQEQFLLRVTPEAVYLLGGSPLGTQHGIYTVLREWGCRWIMPGAIGECLPRQSALSLPVQDRIEGPDFRFRQIWYAYGSSPEGGRRLADWSRRNRMYRPNVGHGHNLTNTLARVAPFDQRPELYSLIDGKREKRQICTANPQTVALVTESIRDQLRKVPAIEAYSLCPDDNTEFCQCDKCLALDSGVPDRSGLPSVADRYQVFLNGVLEGLHDEFPEVLVSTYSYNRNHTNPPVKTPVHPNTCIFATTSEFCSAHGVGDPFCDSRQGFKELLQAWLGHTPHVYIYEYDPVPYSGGLPWPMWKTHGRALPVYAKLGIKGLSFEGQDSWASYFLNYYIAAQMMWDTAQPPEALFEDMLGHFFGEAAGPMRAYYAELDTAFDGYEKKAEWGLSEYPKFFGEALMQKCQAALADAERLATTPIVKKRLEMVGLSFTQMDAYLRIRRADSSMTYDDYKREIDRLNGSIDAMARINEDYLLANIARQKTLTGLADRFAPEQGFINRWQICGPFPNPGMTGHDRAYGPEKAIDLAASFPGKGDGTIRWKVSSTPSWQGYVDFLKEYDETDSVVAYAVCWVTLKEGPRNVLFRIGSNDSVKAFLNGIEIWNHKVERTAGVDADLVPVTLPQGTSSVLLKIGQTGKNWGFYFRITEPDSLDVPQGFSWSEKPSGGNDE